MSGVVVGRGDFGQGWLWPGVIVAGVILGRGDQDSGVILEGWFWRGDFVRGDCGFIPKSTGTARLDYFKNNKQNLSRHLGLLMRFAC